MNHFASPSFWKCYQTLPAEIRDLADKNFALLWFWIGDHAEYERLING